MKESIWMRLYNWRRKALSPFGWLGYWAVAVLCAVAGYTIAFRFRNEGIGSTLIDSLFSDQATQLEVFFLSSYLIFIAPAYSWYQHVYRSDKKILNSEDIIIRWGMRFFLPIILALVVVLFISFKLTQVENWPGTIFGLWSHITNSLELGFFQLMIMLIPYMWWAVWLGFRAQRPSKDDRKIILFFRHRTFFPALLTCCIPFIAGWLFVSYDSSVKVSIWLLVLLIIGILWFYVAQKDQEGTPSLLVQSGITIVLIFLILSITAAYISPSGMGKEVFEGFWILSYSLFLTLVIGVFEASCVTAKVKNGELPVLEQVTSPSEPKTNGAFSFYNKGTNSAATYSLLLLLSTVLYPGVSLTYFLGLIAFAILYLVVWVGGTDSDEYRVRNCFGRIIPAIWLFIVIYGIGMQDSTPLGLPKVLQSTETIFRLIGPVALVVFSLKLFRITESDHPLLGLFLSRGFGGIPYEHKEKCIAWSIMVAGFLSLVMFLILAIGIWFSSASTGTIESNADISVSTSTPEQVIEPLVDSLGISGPILANDADSLHSSLVVDSTMAETAGSSPPVTNKTSSFSLLCQVLMLLFLIYQIASWAALRYLETRKSP